MLTFGFVVAAAVAGFVAGILVGRKNAGTVEQAVSAGKVVVADAQAAVDRIKGN